VANHNPSPETRFKPGNRASPGKPVGSRSVSSRLRDLLDRGEIGGKPIKDGKQVADLLAEVILKQALQGDYRFAQMVLDRTEGKVAEPDNQKDVTRIVVEYENRQVDEAPPGPDDGD
jgi:hypothetical protein